MALTWIGTLAVVLVLLLLLPAPEMSRGLASYVPLHTILEVLAISVGAMIFAVSWSTQSYARAARLAILGVFVLGVSILDLLHALSYQGMPDFVTPSDSEKAINFWLAARFMLALGLLLVAWVPHSADAWLGRQSRYLWLGLITPVLVVVSVLLLFFPQYLPRTFIEGSGLTDFKLYFEYVLVVLYLLAAVGFYRHAGHGCHLSAANLAAASVIFAMSEYLLTLYADVTDVFNLMGHIFKIAGFAFLYRGVFVRLVQQPFQELEQARSSLELTIDTLPDQLIEVDRDGTLQKVHSGEGAGPHFKRFTKGLKLQDLLPDDQVQRVLDALKFAQAAGGARNIRIELPTEDAVRHLDLSISRKPHPDGAAPSFLVLVRDMTEAVEQQQRLALEARVNALLLGLEEHESINNEQTYLQMATEGVLNISASQFAFIHLLDRQEQVVQTITSATSLTGSADSKGMAGEDGSMGFETLNELWQPVLASHAVCVVNSPTEVAGRLTPTHGLVVERFVAVPVFDAGRIRMVLSVGNRKVRYEQVDIEVLQRVAEFVWRGVRLHRQEQVISRLSTALGQSPYPVLITDTQSRIEYVNRAFTKISGYESWEVIGKTPHVLKSGETPPSVYQEMWEKLSQGLTWQGELINQRKDGSTYTEKAMIYPVRNNAGVVTNYVAHKEDITLQRENEERIHQLSNYDQITGLANREVLEERLKQFITRPSEMDLPLTVLWLDLDNFKAVNDSLGHDAGNLLLVKVSNRLRKEFGDQVTLSRVAGDGFVALLPHTDQQTAALLARHLLDVLQQPIRLHSRQLAVSASIGMSIYPGDSDSVTGLMMNAETAMYRVKMEGRNGLRFFSQDMQEHSLRALEIASSLKQADMDREFHMVFQPQMSIADGRFVGAEALLRWTHPVWGNVSPGEFIPIAEQSGRILEIGTWVLRHVAHQMRQWRDAGLGDFSVAVNLSALQFVQTDMVKNIIETVARAGIPSHCIEVELTESVALNNPIAAGQAISALRNAGFLVSIDDFGTGYSSMSYLKRFAVDKLKIDQSFVRELGMDADDRAIVSAIVQMAHSLGMKTIAEGVETEQQLAILKEKACDEIQGYLYSKPLPADVFEQFLRECRQQDGSANLG